MEDQERQVTFSKTEDSMTYVSATILKIDGLKIQTNKTTSNSVSK